MMISIAIIFLWIGPRKFVPYKADSITPRMANQEPHLAANPTLSMQSMFIRIVYGCAHPHVGSAWSDSGV
nr:DUF417 family protein [uncultured Sphingomonas sp.]